MPFLFFIRFDEVSRHGKLLRRHKHQCWLRRLQWPPRTQAHCKTSHCRRAAPCMWPTIPTKMSHSPALQRQTQAGRKLRTGVDSSALGRPAAADNSPARTAALRKPLVALARLLAVLLPPRRGFPSNAGRNKVDPRLHAQASFLSVDSAARVTNLCADLPADLRCFTGPTLAL